MARALRHAYVLVRAGIRTELQYKANFIHSTIGGAAFQSSQLLFIGVLLASFGAIGGWGAEEILLLIGIRMMAHAVYGVVFHETIVSDVVIYQGEFDRYLLRPVNPFLQLLTRRFNLQQVGDLVLAVVVFSIAVGRAPVDWAIGSGLFVAAAIVGGALIEAAFQTARAGLSFRMRSTESLVGVTDDVIGTYCNYPMHIFGLGGLVAFTILIPIAFVSYYPAAVLLGRTEHFWFPGWVGWFTPAIGAGMLWAAYRYFMHQTRHYTSPGT